MDENSIYRFCFPLRSSSLQDLEIKPYKTPTEKTFASKEENIQSLTQAAGRSGNILEAAIPSGSKDSQPSPKLPFAEFFVRELTKPPAWPLTESKKPKLCCFF